MVRVGELNVRGGRKGRVGIDITPLSLKKKLSEKEHVRTSCRKENLGARKHQQKGKEEKTEETGVVGFKNVTGFLEKAGVTKRAPTGYMLKFRHRKGEGKSLSGTCIK